jgi:glucokinase
MIVNLFGIDVGGTKSSVSYGTFGDGRLTIIRKIMFKTQGPKETIAEIENSIDEMMGKYGLGVPDIAAIGISCGGPLDSHAGVIMSPPNLPGWDDIHIVREISNKYMGVSVGIQNDANACALAEWKFGAGRGTKNMVFMTFGTGLGAGLILNGHLYEGTNDNAGEIGHIRLYGFGPIGYGKSGSFEGFCSGGGIAQIARILVREKLQMGEKPAICPSLDKLDGIDAKMVAEAARKGDGIAMETYRISGEYLGRGLSILIDVLNPERIVIGSVYARCTDLLEPYSSQIVQREALKNAAAVCKVIPAELGESIGDYAALSVAANLLK